MSNFTEKLSLNNPDKDCRIWYLADDFSYDLGEEYSGKTIVVPKGFATDGTSIPRLFWWLEPPWGPAARASIIHDYLCVYLKEIGPHPFAATRYEADLILYEALQVAGIPKWKASVFYFCVRLLGRSKIVGQFTNARRNITGLKGTI